MSSQDTESLLVCAGCGSMLPAKAHKNRRFCSQICRLDSATVRPANLPGYSNGLVSGTRGAVSELRAVVDLMERGFHVYRAMSPSCPCDLVVWKGTGRVIRIEVKTGHIELRSGRVYLSKAANSVFDVLCHVLPDSVVYDPPIEEWDA